MNDPKINKNQPIMKPVRYREIVENRFLIYNSLFLNLPFEDIHKTGTLLPLFQQHCKTAFEKGLYPREMVESFFQEYLPESGVEEQRDLLFRLIQYVERQVVLFDSVEDATFEWINDISGKGSLEHLMARVQADALSSDLINKLNKFGLRIVLTAHPTQFYPGSVLAIITDLEEAIRQGDLQNIDLILQQLGKTPFMKRIKPSPYDEAVSLCWYLENIFYRVIPEIIEKIELQAAYLGMDFQNYDLISVGFWPGGDRDGNPFVTHETTHKVATRLRETALKCYYRDIRKLRRRITFKGVEDQLLHIERQIFNAVYGEREKGYHNWEELQEDLRSVKKELKERHQSLFMDLLDQFILKTRIFKFHMAPMDVRQDSRKHRTLWAALTGTAEYIPEREDQAVVDEILSSVPELDSFSPEDDFLREMIETFKIIPAIQEVNGEEACSRYIISNSMGAGDVAIVVAIARAIFGKSSPSIDIIPLFESIDFLARAPEIMELLYQHPVYRSHLEARGNKQTIMLGFSDGTKDGGYLQANYSIFKAKEELTRVSRKYGIKVVFFDGRGGPPSRGGGNTHAFYSSLGPGIEAREIQLTIQGQTISTNFGNPSACRFNLEQLLTSALENAIYPVRQCKLSTIQDQLLNELATESRRAYVALKEHPAFVKYLEQVTPLSFFGKTNIGSRPVKRSGDAPFTFDDLRAIPFVGSWAQMKQNVPGFFGVGTAIEKMAEDGRLNEVKDLYQKSPFFRALVNNSMQSLAKAFFPATTYLRDHPDYAEFFDVIYLEYQRSVKWILAISDQKELLEDNSVSRESIRIREKIILPIIAIQQYALQRLLMEDNELTDSAKVALQGIVLRCMYGIINAARNAA